MILKERLQTLMTITPILRYFNTCISIYNDRLLSDIAKAQMNCEKIIKDILDKYNISYKANSRKTPEYDEYTLAPIKIEQNVDEELSRVVYNTIYEKFLNQLYGKPNDHLELIGRITIGSFIIRKANDTFSTRVIEHNDSRKSLRKKDEVTISIDYDNNFINNVCKVAVDILSNKTKDAFNDIIKINQKVSSIDDFNIEYSEEIENINKPAIKIIITNKKKPGYKLIIKYRYKDNAYNLTIDINSEDCKTYKLRKLLKTKGTQILSVLDSKSFILTLNEFINVLY